MSVYPDSLPSVHGASKLGDINEYMKYPPPDYEVPRAPPTDVRTEPPPRYTAKGATVAPRSYLALAILATISCLPFGVIALIFSLRSRSAARKGKLEQARDRGKLSLAVSLTALFMCVIIIAVILGLYFAYGGGLFHGNRAPSQPPPPPECDPDNKVFDIYLCAQFASPSEECNIASPAFNYYSCFDILHVCNPEALIYNREECERQSYHDVCSPASPAFDLIECAGANIEHECNPFSQVYDHKLCELFDHPSCNPISSGFDVLSCVSEGFLNGAVCDVFSDTFDVLECITGAVDSSTLPGECIPGSSVYDTADCLVNTADMSAIPAICNPFVPEHYDILICLGELAGPEVEECNPPSPQFSLRTCLDLTGSLDGVSDACNLIATGFDLSDCIGTDLSINIDLSSPVCTFGGPDFNIFKCLRNEGEPGSLPAICNPLMSGYDLPACIELNTPDDECNPASSRYDPTACTDELPGTGGDCNPLAGDISSCVDLPAACIPGSSFDLAACFGF